MISEELIQFTYYGSSYDPEEKAGSGECTFCTNPFTGHFTGSFNAVNTCNEHYRILTMLDAIKRRDYETLYAATYVDRGPICDLCKKEAIPSNDTDCYINIPLSSGDHEQSTYKLCAGCRGLLSTIDNLDDYVRIKCDNCIHNFLVETSLYKKLVAHKNKLESNYTDVAFRCLECIQQIYSDAHTRCITEECNKYHECLHRGIRQVDLIIYPPVCECHLTFRIDDEYYITVAKLWHNHKTIEDGYIYKAVINYKRQNIREYYNHDLMDALSSILLIYEKEYK